jgi:hypothetical protein
MAVSTPIREAWVCTFCGSATVMPGPYTALGQYCTGLCKDEGKDRFLILKSAMTPGMIERNARRRFLHKLSGQIAKGALARHSYHAGEKIGRAAAPCDWPQQPPCSFGRAQHPSQADLEEMGWQ